MKKHAATAGRTHPRSTSGRSLPRQAWARRAGRDLTMPGPRDNQVMRGIIVGLPLALALWALLALIVWRTF